MAQGSIHEKRNVIFKVECIYYAYIRWKFVDYMCWFRSSAKCGEGGFEKASSLCPSCFYEWVSLSSF